MRPPIEPRSDGPLARSTVVISMVGCGFLAWGVATQLPSGTWRRAACLALLVVSVAGWAGWSSIRLGAPIFGRSADRLTPRPAGGGLMVSVVAMAGAGGALAAFVPLALVFAGVAALAVTTAWPMREAAPVVLLGPAAMLVTAVSVAGAHPSSVVDLIAAAFSGAAVGASRREARLRVNQAALLQVEEARAEAERARAELLEGRNHLARELHDVLAHTLSALSLNLEALAALVAAGPERAGEVGDGLARSRRLVREGMEEARGAVRVLRDDVGSLQDELSRLHLPMGGAVRVSGNSRSLPPNVTMALYRVAQEAVTNATKHSGMAAEVLLDFAEDHVALTVTNGLPAESTKQPSADGWGPASEQGYGLQGIRERVLLVGGEVHAGPSAQGWTVHVVVPT